MFPNLKVGCCGFPVDKVTYAQSFDVVEVQQTFYQPPQIATLRKWRAMVPEQFTFTLKAWQLITHTSKSPTFRRLKTQLTPKQLDECGSFQDTSIVNDAWDVMCACAEALRASLVLFQCPASFAPTEQNIGQMRKFFTTIKRNNLKLLWEPRGKWPDTLVQSLCLELDLIHVVDPFLSRPVTKNLLYLRLHGGKDFSHVFTAEELQSLVGLIPANQPAYVMFNNRQMWNDAGRFQALVRSTG